MPHAGRESSVTKVHSRTTNLKTLAAGQHSKQSSRKVRRAALAALGLTLLGAAGGVRAADQYWDGDGLGTVGGGSGVWDNTLNRWSDSAAGSVYGPWIGDSVANLTGTGGTINFGSPVTATGLNVTGNYFIHSPTLAPFTLNGASPVVNVAAGSSVEFFNAFAGTNGFTKTGAGAIGIYAATPGGTININEGTLYYANNVAGIPDAANVNLAAGATLDMRLASDTVASLSGAGTVRMGTLLLGVSTGSNLTVGGGNA